MVRPTQDVAVQGNQNTGYLGMDPKSSVFLNRYIRLAHAIHETAQPTSITIAELAKLWYCSERTAQESIQRLETWGLLRWNPKPGRGKRSDLALLIHPVHVYFEEAQHALAKEALAEAGFWLSEVIRECPCIPEAATLLTEIRQRLNMSQIGRCCEPGSLNILS